MQPPHQPTTPLDLSEAELAAVQAYAEQHGLTLDEAATELAQQAIAARYVRRRPEPARVIQLPRNR
ncbi:hypothetical protein [Paracidovorax wautersii]|uniref:Uncharacterized protein n=1 Tax=Paracidovorax wautersii TaxID=1177982 RepID=A0ABU1IGE1_9BURK|nr:hypothetical protein [Paracidovorax wautersii]MDR6216200.1 hypothetical protein [Paracidovorax wautersii]